MWKSCLLVGSIGFSQIFALDSWEELGRCGVGSQFDMVPGPNNEIHVLDQNYYRFDANGKQLERVSGFEGPSAGESMSYPPSLQIDNQGKVHALYRTSGGWKEGYIIKYRSRTALGVWGPSLQVGVPVARNYLVGQAALDNGLVYLVHSEEVNKIGNQKWYRVISDSIQSVGTLKDVTHAEGTFTMRTNGKKVFMAAAKKTKSLSLFHCTADSGNIITALQANKISYSEALMSAMHLHQDGVLDFVYGEPQIVKFARINEKGSYVIQPKKVLDGLGSWTFESGRGIIATSRDKNTIMVVAQSGYNGTVAGDLKLAYTISTDGGKTFSAKKEITPADTMVHGRERLTARVITMGNSFYLAYPSGKRGGLILLRYTFSNEISIAPRFKFGRNKSQINELSSLWNHNALSGRLIYPKNK